MYRYTPHADYLEEMARMDSMYAPYAHKLKNKNRIMNDRKKIRKEKSFHCFILNNNK